MNPKGTIYSAKNGSSAGASTKISERGPKAGQASTFVEGDGRWLSVFERTPVRNTRREEISAQVLRKLVDDCQQSFLGERVKEAGDHCSGVLQTMPQRNATKGRRADRRPCRCCASSTSPTAGGRWPYGLDKKRATRPFLVFDLGGGTFDVQPAGRKATACGGGACHRW